MGPGGSIVRGVVGRERGGRGGSGANSEVKASRLNTVRTSARQLRVAEVAAHHADITRCGGTTSQSEGEILALDSQIWRFSPCSELPVSIMGHIPIAEKEIHSTLLVPSNS